MQYEVKKTIAEISSTVTGCSLYPYRMGHRPKPTESGAEGAETDGK